MGPRFVAIVRDKFVYEMDCDGVPTRYVTVSEWDRTLSVQFVNGEMQCSDSNGDDILVLEEGDAGYHDWDVPVA